MIDLKKDEVWDVFVDGSTFDSFKNNILSTSYLKPSIPEDIRHSVMVLEKLLLCSYYEYEFIDIALTQLVFVFEKAMKLKWFEIHGSHSNLKLQKLIDWFYNNNYFEYANKESPHQLRRIRNQRTHNEARALGGASFLNKFYSTIDFLNDLYECPVLRLIRKEELRIICSRLEEVVKYGSILSFNNKRIIILNAFPFFIDNKSIDKKLHISFCPIFDLTPYKDNSSFPPKHETICLIDFEFNEHDFKGINYETGSLVCLSRIADEINAAKFDAWQNEFNSIENWALLLYLISEPIDKCFLKVLREFHQQ